MRVYKLLFFTLEALHTAGSFMPDAWRAGIRVVRSNDRTRMMGRSNPNLGAGEITSLRFRHFLQPAVTSVSDVER
jgi:hypothetical protein